MAHNAGEACQVRMQTTEIKCEQTRPMLKTHVNMKKPKQAVVFAREHAGIKKKTNVKPHCCREGIVLVWDGVFSFLKKKRKPQHKNVNAARPKMYNTKGRFSKTS